MKLTSSFGLLAICLYTVSCYEYETKYFEQPVDHYGFNTNDIFQQRYLISTKHWNSNNSGPIFYYMGNEGNIEVFAENTGFMWDLAPEYGAMVVFGEHRFYGKSYPYPQEQGKLGLLTSEQALADHGQLIMHLKNTIPGAASSPVIGFGGSYGGMLASWMRIKFPHIVDGVIAASAPVIQFQGMVPCDVYAKSVTKAYSWGGKQCPKVLRKTFDLLVKYGKTADGLKKLEEIFKLCKPLNNYMELTNWIAEGLSSAAMANYPYPNSFLGPLPAWPVKKMCSHLTDSTIEEEKILSNVMSAMSVYYNYSSSQPQCIDLKFSPSQDLGADNWYFQACSEIIMPSCQTGINDMFWPEPWNFTQYAKTCMETYGVRSREFMVELMYGGTKLQAASNIVFSNGEIDPWNGGGIHRDINPTVVALKIKDGAHHLDLRSSNPLDPQSVIDARNIEKKWITKWIQEARQRQNLV